MTHDPVTTLLARGAWIAWLVLVASLVAAMQFDGMALPSDAGGNGYVPVDVTVTVLLCVSVAIQLITELVYPRPDSSTVTISRWLVLCGLSIISARFGWALAETGDIAVHPLSMVAVGAVALGQIMRCVAVWATHVEHRRDSTL